MRPPFFAIVLASALVLVSTAIPVLANNQQSQNNLESLIETGIAYAENPMDVRQAAVEQARDLMAAGHAVTPKARAEFGIADAYLQYQLGNVEQAIEASQLGLEAIGLDSHPNLYVRTHSFLGGLLLTAGKPAEGLRSFETLFEQDLSKVDPARIENARVNYASGLIQNGRIQEASIAYEQALLYALANEDDVLGLSAGSNYISLLRNQGMSGQAEYWLDRLRPAMTRKPSVMATAALELYDYGLTLHNGDTGVAITKIEAFLARPGPTPNLVAAHGEELYSEALLAEGRLQEALIAAERAFELLEQYPMERPEARMAIVRTLLAMQNYPAAGLLLKKLEQTEIPRPSNIAELHKLRLEHALHIGDTETAERAFDDVTLSNQHLLDFVNQRQTDYYQEKLDKQQTELELNLAREEQTRLSAEAVIQKAQASESKVKEKSLRQQREFTIGLIGLVALAGIALIYLRARRQLQTRLRQNLREQNASLEALVESKSKDLVQNVTEQSQLKHALAEHRHMEAIGQIAGHLAHDFNNLLQVISSTNELLAERAQSEGDKLALAASNQSVRSGSSTIRQLLAYSRNQKLEARIFNVSDYLNETGALFRSAVGDVNELALNDRSGAVWVKLDTGQLTASIINLLRNAADALEAPGTIELLASVVPATDNTEQLLQLQVIDHGCGMNKEVLEQASRPYYTTKDEGTGLGLSSVYGFAMQSGGQVALESSPGTGTRVSLRFPVHPGTRANEQPQPGEPISLSGSVVLLVEDNPQIAHTLQAILEREGCLTHWVSAADKAQAAFVEDVAYDVVLSDVMIPGPMDGFGLAQWVRANYPEVNIGLMSGYGPSVEDDFDVPVLAKPFSANELVVYLSHRLSQRPAS